MFKVGDSVVCGGRIATIVGISEIQARIKFKATGDLALAPVTALNFSFDSSSRYHIIDGIRYREDGPVIKGQFTNKSVVVTDSSSEYHGKHGLMIGLCCFKDYDPIVKVLLDNDPIAKQIHFSHLEIIADHL